jgi:hypothetical protein
MEKGSIFCLPNKQRVHYKIKRNGQQKPVDGNKVISLLIVGLEYNINNCIDDELLYGDKFIFIDEPLNVLWGEIVISSSNTYIDRCRTIHKDFVYDTWSEAFEAAEIYILDEINKLTNIINERVAALIYAED